jgi:hypothetical protein
MGRRGAVGGYAVVVLDRNREIVDQLSGVAEADVGPIMLELEERYGPRASVLTNAPERAQRSLAGRRRASPPPVLDQEEDGEDEEELQLDGLGARESVQLMHRMVWQTFRQATQAQAWLMNQANAFTQQLLEGNRRLAEHANALQKHYQERLAEIDYTHRNQKLMEHEEAVRHYSNHVIAKAAAEAAASRPGRRSEVVDELIDGVTAALDCWARIYEEQDDHKRRE